MAWILDVAAALLLAAALYLTLWPVPIAPRVWTPARDAGHTGRFACNRRLAHLRRIDLNGAVGPEHIAFGPDGKLYTGVASGDILRMNPDGSSIERVVNTGGRVLGLTFDATGRLIAADSHLGLIAADSHLGLIAVTAEGAVTKLADTVEGSPILFANAVVIASDGQIYFTDSSCRFAPKRWGGTMEACVRDVLEQSATGRVIAFEPASGRTRIVASGLSFANGIALTVDEASLFVVETGQYRIWRIPTTARGLNLSAGPTGGAALVFDNLPGFPDNLMRGRASADGRPRVWVGLTKPRNPIIDRLADKPFLRKVALRTPKALQPMPRDYGHIFAFTDDGEAVVDLQDPTGGFPEASGAAEFGDRLYVASLSAREIGWMRRPD